MHIYKVLLFLESIAFHIIAFFIDPNLVLIIFFRIINVTMIIINNDNIKRYTIIHDMIIRR